MANFDLDRDSVQETDTKTDIIQEEETTVSDTTETNTKKKKVNDVRITITDDRTPIVILFGPPACGKTMTLIRLSHYLNKAGYSITPDRDFRPSNDHDYEHMCDKFENDLNNDTAADPTNNMNFMLVTVHRRVRNICQILEAAGELYFNPDEPKKEEPLYLEQIKQAKNRKIWVIFLEPEWKDKNIRKAYVDRIKGLYGTTIATTDRVIFLGNKADKAVKYITNQIIDADKYKEHLSFKTDGGLYPGVFEIFKEEHFFKRIFKPYKCDFLPFSTGSYVKGNNTQVVEGGDVYPKKLWNMILKHAGKKW